MTQLAVEGLSIGYGDDTVVEELSFSIDHGEALGLVGESGSGKTQTALALLGLLPPSARVGGSIRLGQERLLSAGRFATEAELNRLRSRRIAMVFQDPSLALNPCVRVGRQLERIVLRHGIADRRGARKKVVQALGRVGLPNPERQARAYAHQLSGGMRQRAMIAAALIAEPELLVADEPTTALDVTVQGQILELLGELREDTALLLITHDLGVVAGHCDRVLVLEHGRLVEAGATRDVFRAPAHAHTRAMLDAQPRLDAEPLVEPTSGPPVFAIEGLEVSYHEAGYGRLKAVNGVDLDVKRAETLAIVGESGSGKTSLMRAALGLLPADAGRVVFLGEVLPAGVAKRSRQVCGQLQMVFQDPVGSLDPQLRIAGIVAEPLREHEPGLSADAIARRVAEALERVGLEADFASRYPHQLSGGQAQRVAIARALITEPRVLVCDEAVAALDGTARRQVLELLLAEQARTGLSIVFIAHDLGVVREIAHRVLVMYLGRPVEMAANDRLFRSPAHPYTRALLDAVPVIDVDTVVAPVNISGEPPSILSPPTGCAFHPRCRYAVTECETVVPALETTDGSAVACIRAGRF